MPDEALLGNLWAKVSRNRSHVAMEELDYCLQKSVKMNMTSGKTDDLHQAAAKASVRAWKSLAHDSAIGP